MGEEGETRKNKKRGERFLKLRIVFSRKAKGKGQEGQV